MARQVLDHGVIIPAEYSDDWYEDMSTNLNKLDEVIGSDADKLSEADVSEVALSGDYDDLTNKPGLKPVATSGDYDDLTNKPNYGILRMTSEALSDSGNGAISNLNSDSKLAAGDYVLDAALKVFQITAVSAPNYTVGTALFQITNASALAAVATSGSYDDLNHLPTYGITRFVNAAITDNSNIAFANISSVDKIKAGDFLLDTAGKMYQISSVDTANETVSVTTPLTQLAVDSSVVHNSGNETVGGSKTFTNDLLIYNSDTTAYASYLNLKNQKNARGSSEVGSQGLQYQDKNNKTLTMLESRVVTNGNTAFNIICYNIDGNNQVVSDGVSVIKSPTATNFAPTTDNAVTSGRTLAKWSDVQTYKVNNLEPSSLFMPSDRGSRLDISGYFTNTGSGYTNDYTVLANGYIFLNLTNVKTVTCYSLDSQSITNFAQSYQRSDDGQIYAFFPVRKNDKFRTLWYSTGGTVTVTGAYFIPCQGNI